MSCEKTSQGGDNAARDIEPPRDASKATLNDTDIDEPYTTFNPDQKRCIAYAAGFSAVFSTLSSFIYYPATTAISKSLNISVEMVNLTITSYMVVAGIAPSIFGDMSDQMGRRPALLTAFALYVGSNIGLALQNNYAALQVLRCLQSAGASSIPGMAYGIFADLAPPSERGFLVGLLLGFANAAPSLGPVLGGILAQKVSWRWIFWLLSIVAGINLLGLSIFLPETSRKLVGNGSRRPFRLINRSLYSILVNRKVAHRKAEKQALIFPNPLSCLVALWQKASFIVIAVGGIEYTIFSCLGASLSAQMIQIYSLNYLTGGLVYLPSGCGGLIAAYGAGRLLDHDYCGLAAKYPERTSKDKNDLTGFPIEKVRLRAVLPLLVVSTAATAGYGWSLGSRTHIAVPLVMQFFTGSSQIAIFVACGTLLTDLNPGRSSTAQASYSLVRCAMSAAGIAALQAMIEGIGIGWTFTVYAVIGGTCFPLLIFLRQRGMAWRKQSVP
jgi:multidrug resistance protein